MASPKIDHCDFDHPPFWFKLEDKIKRLTGGSFFYGKDVESLSLKGEENVLDFGCGGGLASRLIIKSLSAEGHLIGVDTSPYWTAIAARRLKKYPNAEIRTGDIRTMSLPEKSMDAVLAVHVLHHISPEDLPSVASELSRLLKKNGRLLVRERTQPSHGISPDEVRHILDGAGLVEANHNLYGAEYSGIFIRNS